MYGTELKNSHVPQYEYLNTKEFMKFADKYPYVTNCFPDRK